jgi:hypothetical protein
MISGGLKAKLAATEAYNHQYVNIPLRAYNGIAISYRAVMLD